jgi:hypothetical protein
MLRSTLLTVQIALEHSLPASAVMLKTSDSLRRPRGSWRPRSRFPKASRAGRSAGAVAVDSTAVAGPPLADTTAFKRRKYLDSIPDEHLDAADAGLVPGARCLIARQVPRLFPRRRA